jgi:hypothetical protein
LTNGKFAGQKFDAPKIVALGLMSERTLGLTADAAAAGPAKTPRATYAEAVLTAEASNMTPPVTPAGTDLALKVLESTLIGGDVSAKTNQQIHQQLTQASGQNSDPGDMLNLLTALVMGSPEFQLR